jgi:hypothetical protein
LVDIEKSREEWWVSAAISESNAWQWPPLKLSQTHEGRTDAPTTIMSPHDEQNLPVCSTAPHLPHDGSTDTGAAAAAATTALPHSLQNLALWFGAPQLPQLLPPPPWLMAARAALAMAGGGGALYELELAAAADAATWAGAAGGASARAMPVSENVVAP